jgi:hypothetical protein
VRSMRAQYECPTIQELILLGQQTAQRLTDLDTKPVVAFCPEAGQHTAELEVPIHLQKMEPGELHGAVRVDTQGEYRRLIAK